MTNLAGWRTMAWSLFLVVLGAVLTYVSSITPDGLAALLPAKLAPFSPMLISIIGLVTGYLRTITTTPVGVPPVVTPPKT